MPDPATIAMIGAEVLPFVLSMFGKGPEEIDYQETLRTLIAEFESVLGPAGEAVAQQATRSAGVAGAALRQDVADSTGRIGGGSAGATRVNRGLASSASSRMAGEAGAAARFKVAQSITALANQALPTAISSQTMTKAQTGNQAMINNMLQGLAGVTAADGKNPFASLLERIIGDSEAGEKPFSVADLAGLMNSPLITGFTGNSGGYTMPTNKTHPTGYGSSPAAGRAFLAAEKPMGFK